MADISGINALPQELIEEIVSRTSPGDACGALSLVSKKIRAAANSDHVWERFLPLHIISRRAASHRCMSDDPWKNIDSDTLHAFPTKKDLYLFLSDNPLLIDDNGDNALYFCLEKLSGNRCFHIGPRDLQLHPKEWWMVLRHVQQRFTYWGSDLAFLRGAINLEVEGRISTSLLFPNTTYTAYLLFDVSSFHSCFVGFGAKQPLETWVGIDGHGEKRNVYIPHENDVLVSTGPRYPVLRHGHWYEVELGDYLNKELGVGSSELRMSLREVKSGRWKGGLMLSGIEIRPKSSKKINWI